MPEMTGEQLGLLGMALADEAASDAWKAKWDRAIILLAISGEPFCADDIREIAGPPTDHPNACGSRLQAAARAGLIRHWGYVKSSRAVLHAHPIALWIGTARAREVAA